MVKYVNYIFIGFLLICTKLSADVSVYPLVSCFTESDTRSVTVVQNGVEYTVPLPSGTVFIPADIDAVKSPEDDYLLKVFPNPTKGNINIRYKAPSSAPVSLNMYNLQGGLVKSLTNSEIASQANENTLTWNFANDRGVHLSNGTYLLQMMVNAKIPGVEKIILSN
ncbi:MAG: T9SS type A sorting domain-containing protein [Dysgonamonadaceae bacterium]|jgi:hypothetical protein|nr:T9SS type A sorting domain-containing protein [Dysgonamonadaceae bacterium]